ncbi:hypothetical protein [Pseudomonas sp. Marseille-Q5115]|nr:hypothetical protein [Pseudomonas sp. Marseille-Q5115]
MTRPLMDLDAQVASIDADERTGALLVATSSANSAFSTQALNHVMLF